MKLRINECDCGCGGTTSSCMSKMTGAEEKELGSYMFFGNLQTIRRAIDALLQMDAGQVDAVLADGHNWAADHIATAKDDIEEVTGFLMNKMETVHFAGKQMGMDPFMEESKTSIYSFNQFVFEAKKQMKEEEKKGKKKAAPTKKKSAKRMDQDGDGDMDFADAKLAQYKAGGMDKKKAMMMSRKFNK